MKTGSGQERNTDTLQRALPHVYKFLRYESRDMLPFPIPLKVIVSMVEYNLIRCRLSFSLLRSAIMCLRGSRSTAGHPLKDFDFILAGTEGRLPLTD